MTGPGKHDGTSPEFAEHASVEAIDHQLRRARAARDRWDRHIRKLTKLRAVRVAAAAGVAAAADEALAAALADVTVARVRRPNYARAAEEAYEAHEAAAEPRSLPKCCRDHGVPARVAACGWDCHEAHTYVLPCELANEALRRLRPAGHVRGVRRLRSMPVRVRRRVVPGMTECGSCAGCLGMGPCEEIRSDECGRCALEADHFGPCRWPGDPENNDDDT